VRVLEVYRNCDRGHAVGYLLLKPKPQPQHEGLHTTRDADSELLGLDSVADGRCNRASQGFDPSAGVEVLCLNRARIRITPKRKLLFADGCERTPSGLESHPWWHIGGDVKKPRFLRETWCFLGLLVCEQS